MTGTGDPGKDSPTGVWCLTWRHRVLLTLGPPAYLLELDVRGRTLSS
jgi:hypothetical protein